MVEVVADAADVGGQVHDHGWIVLGEHGLGSTGSGEVELDRSRSSDVGATLGEAGDDPATQESGASGDERLAARPRGCLFRQWTMAST